MASCPWTVVLWKAPCCRPRGLQTTGGGWLVCIQQNWWPTGGPNRLEDTVSSQGGDHQTPKITIHDPSLEKKPSSGLQQHQQLGCPGPEVDTVTMGNGAQLMSSSQASATTLFSYWCIQIWGQLCCFVCHNLHNCRLSILGLCIQSYQKSGALP